MTAASPFPGMDPFLEDPTEWGGVHIRLISSISDQLTTLVQPNFSVKIEEHLYLIETPTQATWSSAAIGIMTPTMVEPIYSTEITERWIEIRDKRDRSVITTIEVLSPFNTAGRTAFLQKRNNVMLSHTHWVEIDLLRAGERPIEVAGKSDYYALLKRSGVLGLYEVWYFDLRDRLPTIAIPLRPPFDDVPLDLQAVFTDVYQRGRYAADIDYSGDAPAPILRPPVALWVKKQIAEWRDQEDAAPA